MADAELAEAARIIESLVGMPPAAPGLRKMSRRERREQAGRVKRFLSLPAPLQEGALQYAERMRQSYRGL